MKTKKYVKKAVAGMSAFAIGAVSIIPTMPVMAAETANEAEMRALLEEAAELGEEPAEETVENAGTATAAETEAVKELTKDTIAANDHVLYIANCGTSDPAVVPNQDSERLGLLQSNVDQAYGVDLQTGRTWGLSPDTEYSIAKKHADNATDIGNSFIYMGTEAKFDKYKSTLGYDFEVFDENEKIDGIKSDTYEVTVAFKHYWDERWLNISLEGQTVATDLHVGYDSWVSRTFTTTVTDGELNVDVSSPRRNGTNQDPIINFIKVRAVEDKEKEVATYDSISGTAGDVRYDTNGNQIQAHGGQIQKLTVDGVEKYYWIGEDKTNDYRPVGGIHVYSSEDLYNWDDEGVVLRTMENPDQFENDPYFSKLYGDLTKEEQDKIFVDLDKNNAVMERPKMLYNEKTGKYVIWFHADGRTPENDADYGKAKAGVAIADSPTGPFKLLGSSKLYHAGDNYGYDGYESRGSVRDMNLFKDDDGQAYVIYSSEGNQTTYIAKLNDEYTGLATENRDDGVEGVHFTRNFAGWSREAPAMFKYKDKYYIINSGCTGWSPNRADYAVADNPLGPWTSKGDPCTDWGSDTTYQTQSTCVFPVDAEAGKYIYMGDRWNSGDLSESRYVWLPVEFQEGDKIALRRYDNWTLKELENKGTYDVVTENLPTTAASAEEVIDALPEKVTITNGTTSSEHAVTWETDKLTAETIGEVTVKGKMDNGETVSFETQIVNPNTVYFFDSYATKSTYFDAVKEAAGDKLLNTQPDQKYTEETKAGYAGILETEDSENFDMGVHAGNDMWESGYWAESKKTIDYAFTLKPGTYSLAAGFQEWWADWADSRDMKITISQNDQVLAEKECSVKDNTIQTAQEFTVAEEGLVTVCISKTGGSDQVLSWIGVIEKTSETPDQEETADKTSLNHAITMAESMEKEQEANKCYTKESWEKVAEALEAARALAEDKEADQKAVDEAFLNLITACSTLENAAQKVGLKAAIAGAETILADTEHLAQYTQESVEAVRTALEEAQAVFENEAADQGTINNATTRLLTAVNSMLLVKEGENTRLDVLISMAETLLKNKDQYTASSVAALEKALEAAKNMAEKADATEAEITEAYNTLAEAMTSLVRKANKDELKNALDKANEIITNKADYTESSLAGLEEAKNTASAVYDKDDATQDEVGEALRSLIAEILEARLLGDVDANGKVDSEDAAAVLRYNVELETLSEEQLDAADVNKDEAADSSDAGAILQYAAEKIAEF